MVHSVLVASSLTGKQSLTGMSICSDREVVNPLMSKPAETGRLSILLCLTPDDFTRQWGTPGRQWVIIVNVRIKNLVLSTELIM